MNGLEKGVWATGVLVVAVAGVGAMWMLHRADNKKDLDVLRACSLAGCGTYKENRNGNAATFKEIFDLGCKNNTNIEAISIDEKLLTTLQNDGSWKNSACVGSIDTSSTAVKELRSSVEEAQKLRTKENAPSDVSQNGAGEAHGEGHPK